MVKNAHGQSNFEIIKSTISQEQQEQSARIFTWWDRLKEDKGWFENVLFGEVKKALVQSDCRIPESTISQVRINESTWFLACRYRF